MNREVTFDVIRLPITSEGIKRKVTPFQIYFQINKA